LRLDGTSLARLIGFIGLTSLLLVVGSVLALAVYEHHRLTAQAERETRTTAFFLADHASRLFEAADFALQQSGRRIEGLSWDEVASRPVWQELRNLVRALPYVSALFLSDSRGELRLLTSTFPPPSSNFADREWFIAQLQPGASDGIHIGHLLMGRVSGQPTFILSRRLAEGDGTFRGVVAASADLNYFDRFWSRLESRFAPRVSLFRADDLDVLVQQPAVAVGGAFLPAQIAAIGEAIAASTASGTTRIGPDAPDGKSQVLSCERVGTFPLYLSVGISEEFIDAVWRQQVLPYLLFGGAAALALLALTAFAFRQARRDAHGRAVLAHTVEERTAALTAATAELRTLLDELNHRVKNNLQVVTSLLRLQSQRSDDPRLRRALDDSVQRIQAMALLHQQLSLADAQSGLSFGSYLRDLAARLAQAYGAEGRIQVDVEADGSCLNLQTATPLALIINEVVSNALKYAFPDGRRGRIVLRLARVDGGCQLTVHDDGVGLPHDLDWRKSGGLGMRIIRSLASQLEGAAEYAVGGGTRFSLWFAPSHQPVDPGR
jgi:two-component sensor histidine kinase